MIIVKPHIQVFQLEFPQVHAPRQSRFLGTFRFTAERIDQVIVIEQAVLLGPADVNDNVLQVQGVDLNLLVQEGAEIQINFEQADGSQRVLGQILHIEAFDDDGFWELDSKIPNFDPAVRLIRDPTRGVFRNFKLDCGNLNDQSDGEE
jgi:hypothetical protein